MARQTGPLKIIGTFNGVTYYQMQEDFFARKASSLTGKRFRKDKAFKNSRKSSADFARANKLAKEVYRMIEKNRKLEQYRLLVKTAIGLFKQGMEEAFIRRTLFTSAGLPAES